MSMTSRLLRALLAIACLHLMLAVPARACAHDMATPATMEHAGHSMPGAPAPKAPCQHHEPTCPMPAGACQLSMCVSVMVAEQVAVSATAAFLPEVAAIPVHTSNWLSVSHPPEPPPPRA